ncbi:hypothetical protein ADO05_02054 [Streptococcus parauberis]|nr:hypothetical protein ADO05_02054 [Streptococcus parauberis]POS66636.1 hypothetical protein AOS90_01887 [Streptococcus parauberis]
MKTMPENQLATISSGNFTFGTFSMVISKALVSALILFLLATMRTQWNSLPKKKKILKTILKS